MGFTIEGFGVWGEVLEFRVWGFGIRVSVEGSGFWVEGGVQCSAIRVSFGGDVGVGE